MREALVDAERRLTLAGVASPRYDAETLMSQTLHLTRGRIDLGAPLEQQSAEEFSKLVARRCRRIPLQHITGLAPFRYLSLIVGEGVFTPRPETELVAEAAIRELRRLARPASVLDLGSGSGAIALAIATECPNVSVTAVEASPQARCWLEKNLTKYQAEVTDVGSSIDLIETDFGQPVFSWLPDAEGAFDVVVSNPPYVPINAQIRDIEAANFDPPIALYGGEDGLDLIKLVIEVASVVLRPGGLLIVEHGDEQGALALTDGVPHWVKNHGSFTDINDRPDLNSRPRFTTAIRL